MNATIELNPATDPHPIVELIIPSLRDAFRGIRGVEILVDRYWLLDEDRPPILERLAAIQSETEKLWVVGSLFALYRWIVQEGYLERARAVAELARGLGEIGRAEWLRLECSGEDAIRDAAQRFTGASRPQLPSTQRPAGQSQLSLRVKVARGPQGEDEGMP